MRCILSGAAAALLVLLSTHAPAPAADEAPTAASRPAEPNHLDRGRLIGFNFQDADIDSVLAYLSRVAGVTFLKETTVSGEVTIVNQQKLTVGKAFDVLNAVLRVKGATCIVNETRLVKIVPISEAKRADLPVYVVTRVEDIPPGDSFVHAVVPLKRAKAKTLAIEMKKLISPYGDLSAASQGNCLIITDTANNVRKLLRIVRQADTDPQAVAEMRIFKLKHADAKKVADILKQVFAPARSRQRGQPQTTFRFRGRTFTSARSTTSPEEGAAVPVRVTVEERLNAVVVVAGPEQMQQVADLVAELDVPPEAARLVWEVVPLEHGDCTEMAKTLKEIFQPPRTRRTSARTPAGPTTFWRRLTTGRGTQGQNQSAPPAREELLVTADRRTNSIVLAGTREQVEVAKQIIQRLAADIDHLEIPIVELVVEREFADLVLA